MYKIKYNKIYEYLNLFIIYKCKILFMYFFIYYSIYQVRGNVILKYEILLLV